MKHIKGRARLAAALCAGLLVTLAGCGVGGGGGEAATEKTKIRFSWWGNPERAELTQKAIDLFEKKNPGIEIQPDFAEFEAYWQKMATEMAGGGGPDVLQMDYSYLKQYASRNLILDLGGQASKGALTLTGFRQGLADTGKIDGKQVAVPWSGNTFAMLYRPDIFAEAKVDLPKKGWSWTEFHATIEKLSKAAVVKDMKGAGDYTGVYHLMDLWLRQQGKSFYTPDGKLGFGKEELRTWFTQTKQFRDDELLLSAQRAAQLDPKPALSADAVAMEPNWDNFIGRYVGEAPDAEFAIGPVPSLKPDTAGLYLKPSMLLSVSTRSQQPDAAAKLVNFMVSDPEAAKILGTNRGIPATEAALAALELNDVDQMIVDYEKSVADLMQPAPPPPPAGAGTIEQAMRDISEELNFKRLTVDQAVDRFFTEAEQAIAAGTD
ncbi:extracellular solute-binding protein [Streptosporangium soli]|nr:extracellular solute-binding protein [Streptosporangium sp. KLBMP 9127]